MTQAQKGVMAETNASSGHIKLSESHVVMDETDSSENSKIRRSWEPKDNESRVNH